MHLTKQQTWGQPTWCELPPASYGEMWVCDGRFLLASVSQPEVDHSGGTRDRPWAFVSCRAVFLWLAASNLLCYYPVPQLEFLRQIKQQWWWRKKWQQQRKKMPLRFTFAWWARRSCRVFWGWKWQCLALPWHEMHSFPSLWWVKCKLGCVPDL